MYPRALTLNADHDETFFLWGPRKTGKSSLLRERFKDAHFFNLLDTDQFIKFSTRPALFREECLGVIALLNTRQPRPWFIIDEVQKIPALLDEVHLLIEEHGLKFGLCGSSARKLKRGHANLLGGRAVRYELSGLVSIELGDDFDLIKLLNRGYLPSHYLNDRYPKILAAYVNEYLKEEIAAEGLVRNLPVFSDFLRSASFSDGEIINYTKIASECGVSSPTVKEYFQILQDTLIATNLPAYTRRPKRKVIHAPKFYFFDVALTNILTRRKNLEPGTEAFGHAFENWIHHEIRSYLSYRSIDADFSYWRLADTGREVDFVLNDLEIAIEAKAKSQIRPDDLRGLRELAVDHPKVKRRLVVCLETKRRVTEDNILIMGYADFVRALWNGEWL